MFRKMLPLAVAIVLVLIVARRRTTTLAVAGRAGRAVEIKRST